MLKRDNIISVMALLSLMAISPVLPAIGIPGGVVFLGSLMITLVLLSEHKVIKFNYLIIILCLTAISYIPAVYHTSIERLMVPTYLLISLLTASLLKYEHFVKITHYFTALILLLLTGAICAFIYKLGGGTELFSINNPDGRINYFIPFSFSNSVWYNFIRPAGIFDEPGAFSFFICTLVTLRMLLNFDSGVSFWILIIGLITFSLAHIIYLIFFIFSSKENKIRWVVYLFFFSLLFLLSVVLTGAYEIFYNMFLIRFEITETGRLHGDNRTQLLLNTFNIIQTNLSFVLFGLSDELLSNEELFQNTFGNGMQTGANPLNLLLKLGLTSIFYYGFLLLIILTVILNGRRKLYLAAFALIFLQRDYIYVISYCFAGSLVIALMFKERSYESCR